MPRAREQPEDDAPAQESGAEDAAEQSGEDDEPEYEIEAILEFKPDVFGKGKGGYLVKWKDYGPEENSWVRPEDAGNAQGLIDEFMKQHPAPSSSTPAPKRARGRQSKAKEPSAETEPSPQPDRRKSRVSTGAGRASTTNRNKIEMDEDDDEEEAEKEDEPARTSGKRGRKSNGTAGAAGRKKRQRTEEDEEEEEDERTAVLTPSTLAKYRDRQNWESAVRTIETVERGKDKKLQVFFHLKGIDQPCVEDNELCKKKFPLKLLEFYEKNLRWKTADSDEQEE